MIEICKLFDVSKTQAVNYLKNFVYPWEALSGIKDFIVALGEGLSKQEFDQIKPHVWIHKTVKLADTVQIQGPCIVDEHSQLRQSAFIRGGVLVGKECVVGNSTEVKNSIIFDNAQIPHFNYVGDSILGFHVHFGAGVITSNLKADKTCVAVSDGQNKFFTGLKKVGAFVGDNVEIGCNSVLNPGSVIGRNTRVYPLSSVRGCVGPNKIYKSQNNIVNLEES